MKTNQHLAVIACVLLNSLTSFADSTKADDFICEINNDHFLNIYGLSSTAENHQVDLQFASHIHPNPHVEADVTTTEVREFVDWGGPGLKMKRTIVASVLPYPTFHFKIELDQSTGGHCEQFNCRLHGTFYRYLSGREQAQRFSCKRIDHGR